MKCHNHPEKDAAGACVGCGKCAENCPVNAIEAVEIDV